MRGPFRGLFGSANKRTFWRHDDTFDARVSTRSKGYSQQRNLVHRVIALQWTHERRLVLVASPTWLGWFCERCCWHITLDAEPTQGQQTLQAQSQFDAHDCEQYARKNWASGGEAPYKDDE